MQVLRKAAPRIRRAYRAQAELEAREHWPRERIDAYQLMRVNELWRHAVEHVPYHRALRAELGLPDRFDTLDQFRDRLPILDKTTLRTRAAEFKSERPGRGAYRQTSGSTGRPMEFFWNHGAHHEVLRARYRFYCSWGVDIVDRTAFVWGGGGLHQRFDDVRQSIEDRLRGRLRLGADILDPLTLRENLDRIRHHRPTMLYGFTQAIYLLAREAIVSDVDCPSLRAVVVTGEIATPHVLATIETAFGVPAVVEYGSTECNLIAGLAPDRTLRVREDVVLLETELRTDGRYDLVMTVLGNHAFPLLRYRIEDTSGRPLETGPAGFAILHDLVGRDDDLIFTSDGAPVHSAAIDEVFEDRTDLVRRYRVHQRGDGAVEVQMIPTEQCTDDDEAAIAAALRQIVGDYPVEVEAVERIETTEAGKHRVVTSDLAASF